MLEYLDQLIEEKKWEEALAYAEQLLSEIDDDPHQLLRLNVAILMSRQELGEFLGAQTIGQLCLKMAKELQSWEYFGTVCLYLGTAHDRMGQYDQAIATWFEFLIEPITDPKNPFLESVIRYNMGTVYARTGKYSDAIKAFYDSLRVAEDHGLERLAHGIRHALIDTHVKLGDVSEVPTLLAKSLHFIHHLEVLPGEPDVSRLWHFVLRAEFAFASRRFVRAELVARKGLSESGDNHRLRTSLYMLLARVAKAQGNVGQAVEHALAARISAITCRRYDLELDAAEFMYELLTTE